MADLEVIYSIKILSIKIPTFAIAELFPQEHCKCVSNQSMDARCNGQHSLAVAVRENAAWKGTKKQIVTERKINIPFRLTFTRNTLLTYAQIKFSPFNVRNTVGK